MTAAHPLQVAILAGDFLLARASVSLAALRNTEVIELLSQVIEHLVSGEILQVGFTATPLPPASSVAVHLCDPVPEPCILSPLYLHAIVLPRMWT